MTIYHLINQPATFHPILIVAAACVYIILALQLSHRSTLLLWISYLPTLLHEFGHVLFCVMTGGKVKDIVIVARMPERIQTSRQGYAVTVTQGSFNQFMTTVGGYLFPPLMMMLSIMLLYYERPIFFWIALLFIFIYYCIKTSRKLLPAIIIIFFGIIIYYVGRHPGTAQYTGILYHIIAGILLADTLLVIRTISLVYFKDHSTEWDGAVLSRLTRIPVFFYYLLFIIFNIMAGYWAISLIKDYM